MLSWDSWTWWTVPLLSRRFVQSRSMVVNWVRLDFQDALWMRGGLTDNRRQTSTMPPLMVGHESSAIRKRSAHKIVSFHLSLIYRKTSRSMQIGGIVRIASRKSANRTLMKKSRQCSPDTISLRWTLFPALYRFFLSCLLHWCSAVTVSRAKTHLLRTPLSQKPKTHLGYLSLCWSSG